MMTTCNEIFLGVVVFNIIFWLYLLREQRRRDYKLTRWVEYNTGWQSFKTNDKLKKFKNEVLGKSDQAIIKAKISESLAERAFNLASSANLACMALQKSLAVRPVYVPKRQQEANEVAQKTVMEAVGGKADYTQFDWLYPVLSEEEREILDNALEHNAKHKVEQEV